MAGLLLGCTDPAVNTFLLLLLLNCSHCSITDKFSVLLSCAKRSRGHEDNQCNSCCCLL
jgi:hypothetical protein